MQRSLILFVLACALFLRIWVPVGWMPSATGGVFALEPCAAAAMPMNHASHHGTDHKDQHDGDCSFAPHHSSLAPAAQTPLLIASAEHRFVPRQQGAAHYDPTGPPAPPPPATGPPALV